MKTLSRRRFLKSAATAGVLAEATTWLGKGPQVFAQDASSTELVVDSSRRIAPLDRNLFGSFVEHLGRSVYGGIYEPGSKFDDGRGYRKDVLEEVRQMGVPIIRYPGGNFVSGYNWLDGVGPKAQRPRVLDRAWNTIEPNQFGTNEFITWARAVGAEPLLGTNFGTGTVESTVALMEYCNVERGTKWSELRRQHGYEKPHNVKYWCLGNEMDGPWQIGHIPAREYGSKARDAARQMRALDPTAKFIACGSSGPFMATYLDWDQQVLEECFDEVDAISLHRYFDNSDETGGDTAKFLALNLSMDRQIQEIMAVCDVVRGRRRSAKTLWLSFDEWNVWYRKRAGTDVDGQRQLAPHLLEEVYNLEDALLVGGLLNTLLRRSDRVRVACLAQLVNVIAPLLTNEDGLLRQTIWYPYTWALKYARGSALNLASQGPSYEVSRLGRPVEQGGRSIPGLGQVPYLDVAATLDDASKTVTLFILNRDLDRARELRVNWHDLTPQGVNVCSVLTGADLKAANTFAAPKLVAPQPLEAPKLGRQMLLQLPAHSYTLLSLALG